MKKWGMKPPAAFSYFLLSSPYLSNRDRMPDCCRRGINGGAFPEQNQRAALFMLVPPAPMLTFLMFQMWEMSFNSAQSWSLNISCLLLGESHPWKFLDCRSILFIWAFNWSLICRGFQGIYSLKKRIMFIELSIVNHFEPQGEKQDINFPNK